jgi:hypothetical protein
MSSIQFGAVTYRDLVSHKYFRDKVQNKEIEVLSVLPVRDTAFVYDVTFKELNSGNIVMKSYRGVLVKEPETDVIIHDLDLVG